ncbi:MAG: radical SAM protein [Desulfobacteraceae bacterium]|nr:MAG: radical SAM protein [Desulfobacteraceae bacterium]
MIPYTKLRSTNRQNLMDILPLKMPFTVLIEPSSLCNFRCIQCFQSLKQETYFSHNRRNMDLGLYQKVIMQLRDWGRQIKVLKISLYGEPLCNPYFGEMLRLAKSANIAERIETTTNASLLSEQVAAGMIEHQLDYIRVSIYSPHQLKHERITRTSTQINSIHENLRVLQEMKRHAGSERPFVAVKMIDTYGPDNDTFFQMYRDVADEMYIDKPHNWIRTSPAKFTDILYKDNAAKAAEDIKASSEQRFACPMPFTTLAVRSNGDVSPCCVDFIGGTNLGSVKDKTLKELWTSDAWHNFLIMQLQNQKHENSSCARCEFFKSSYYIKDTIDGFDVNRLRL